MGLQMLSTSNKRTREDCLNGEEDEDSPIPAKMGKTDDSLWEEYYPAGKCYQCNEGGSFYNTPFSCEQYSTASNQCWPAQLPHQGSANVNANLNQTNSQCSVHLTNHLCNNNAIANPSNVSNNHLSISSSSIASSVGPAFHSQQQTIRCDENGKSYLDLGSGSTNPANSNSFISGSMCSGNIANNNVSRCCNPRTKWCICGPSCYRQRRLSVLNISMCKLGRYRQFTDPSLYRSVLICNTLRYIEREMEQEGCFANSQQIAPLIVLEPPPEPPRALTPYPLTSPQDNDSGIGDDNRSINWGSVLSLSSQSDLDPLNNNDSLGELDFSQDLEDIIPSCKLTPLSVDELLKSMPPTTTMQSVKESPDIDHIMQVLRFTN
ncbi:hypothetical protein PGB90_002229 [Kerria lacca]